MKISLALALLTLLIAPPALAAGGPDRLNYQGVLRDAAGDPRQGTFDMRFRFFDAATLGNEVLVDAHLGAGTGGVVVTGGLFNVPLGSGDVLDGAGPGVFGSIGEVVGQLDAVWLEIEVAGETLAPRVQVLSSAYALNAKLFQGKDAADFLDTSAATQEKTGLLVASGGVDFGPGADDDFSAADVSALTGGGNADSLHTHTLVGNASNADLLDSLDSSQFLRSDTDDTYTSGTLTLAPGTVLSAKGETRLDGKLFMDYDGPESSQRIQFYDGGSPMGESFGWDEAQDRFTLSNTLRLENGSGLQQTGDSLYVKSAGPDGSQAIYFYDTGEPTGQSIFWDDTNGQFWLSSDASVNGDLTVADWMYVHGQLQITSDAGGDGNQKLGFHDDGSLGNEYLIWNDLTDLFQLSNDLQVAGSVRVDGDEISMSVLGGDRNQYLRFYEDGLAGAESIQWDDAQDRFEVTDELAVGGVIRTGSTGSSPVGYNVIGSGTATSTDMTNILDLFVSGDLEVGDQLYMGGDNSLEWATGGLFHFDAGLHVGDTVGENLVLGGRRVYFDTGAPGNPLGQFLEYFSGSFNMSDDLDVNGTLTANSKNFVQNHPYDPGLEIVYTTLEGPEAATFTRGSARLTNGRVRVPLDESFAWVAHPDLGLTVSLTPRGAFADLYVVEVTTSELVVAATPESSPDAAFDYLVMGLRVGYEEAPVLRPRRRESGLPLPESLREPIAGRPELARHTPLARYQRTAADVYGATVDLAAGNALRSAIGTDAGVASTLDVRDGVAEERPQPQAPRAAIVEPNSPAAGRDARETPARLAFEDEHGNLYARSFRPNSGALDSLSPVSGDVAPGDVLAFDLAGGGVRRADVAGDAGVVGIATGAPMVDGDGRTSVPFAVAGIVTCNVDATGGEIRPGDLLVSSPIAGHAMRADAPAPGSVLGKALEALPEGTGLIRVLVVLR